MRKNLIMAAFMSLCLLFTGCNNEVNTLPGSISSFTSDDSDSGSSSDSDTPPAVEVGFRVDGTKLLDAKGNEFVMRGINHAHVWFRD